MQDTIKMNKLQEAENTLIVLRASAMRAASNETVDTKAAEFGMTRRELVSYVIKHIKSKPAYYGSVLTVNCTLHAHSILQGVVRELEKIGFQAEYEIFIKDFAYHTYTQTGSFAIYMVGDGESERFSKLYKADAFSALTPSIQVNPPHTEYDLYYEHRAGRDETPMRNALSYLNAWAKSLREKDRDLLTAISKLYWTP